MSIETRLHRLETSGRFSLRNERICLALIHDYQTVAQQEDEIEKARAAADALPENVMVIRFVTPTDGGLKYPEGHA